MDEIIWRTSLFLYARYQKRPYFTYFRVTIFTRKELSGWDVQWLDDLLWEQAVEAFGYGPLANESKLEEEQVFEKESDGLGINIIEYARSDGRKGMPLEERDKLFTNIDRFGPPEPSGGLDKFLEDVE